MRFFSVYDFIRFIIANHDYITFEGLGNTLIFFPSIYHFATITGRELLIPDKSLLGEFCQLLYCGFPFVETVSNTYPEVFTYGNIKQAKGVRAHDFNLYVENRLPLVDEQILRSYGNSARSDWWVWYNDTVHCLSKVYGCDLGDIACADRHAYQHLVRGPLRNETVRAILQDRLSSKDIPPSFLYGILNLPHRYAPRIDLTIHLRTQFDNFERKAYVDRNNPDYISEVNLWINSSDTIAIFDALESKVVEIMVEKERNLNPVESNGKEQFVKNFYLYIASDNIDARYALARRFIKYNGSQSELYIGNYSVAIIQYKDSSQHSPVVHTKHYTDLMVVTNGQGLTDLAFDWYMISLSNYVLAWRRGSSASTSTFLMSAQRMSGDKRRTNIHIPLGEGGIGTKGYQLVRHPRRGYLMWVPLWTYDFIEDYKQR